MTIVALTMPATSSHLLGLKLGQVPNPSDGGGGGGSSSSGGGGATGRSCGRGAASKATGTTLAPKPEPAICGRRNSKAQDPGKKVLGYAAVAAERRSFEQRAAVVERMQPRPGRVWLSSGGRGPNSSRPATQPLPTRGLRSRLYGSPPTASEGGRPVRTVGGSVASVACSFDSMASATALEDGNANVHAKEFPRPPSMLVFSGGTAFNGVVEELKKLTTNVTHVLPVSDDGGSTSEILRVLGGPALGDIRSRCLRLSDESSAEALAVKRLLGYRLPLNSAEAKAEWYNIVEGEHGLWNDVSGPYRETIRAFLVFFQTQILMHSNEKFCFSNGSIGNFFFAGARIFFQSLDAAIFLYSRVSAIPVDSIVLPVICTNDRLTLGCELYDGSFVRGQNEISHPVKGDDSESSQVVDKGSSSTPPLASPIKRIFYMSTNGINASHEVFPPVNTRVLERIIEVDAIIYGMGSLYTSICPLLVLRGVGEAIAKQTCPKLLLLNGTHDRETAGMSASDFIISICDALNRKYGDSKSTLDYPPTAYVNVVLVPKNGGIPVDTNQLAALGITQVVVVDSMQDERSGTIFDPKSLIACLDYAISCYMKSDSEPRDSLDKRKKSPTRINK